MPKSPKHSVSADPPSTASNGDTRTSERRPQVAKNTRPSAVSVGARTWRARWRNSTTACYGRMVSFYEPRAICHESWVCTGFTAGRLGQVGPYISHTGDEWEGRLPNITQIQWLTALCVGAGLEAFLARQVPTNGRCKTVAKTDSRGWRLAVRFDHSPFEYNGEVLQTTNHETRFFPRAEGHSRRCC